MPTFLGDRSAGQTVIATFNTQDAIGSPVTLAGTPSIEVWRDDGTVITAGITLEVDVDLGSGAVTGYHRVTIDTSASASYATAHDFDIVIAAGTVDSVSKVGELIGSFALSNTLLVAVPAAVWAVGTRTLTSFGTLVSDVATAVWGATTRLLTAGTNIVLAKGTGVTGFTDLSQADVRTAIGLASANLDTQLAAIPTAGVVADAVWEEAIADHSGTSGSTAEALAAAGSAGDPWTTAIPGAYGAGTAGKVVGDALDAAVSTRASASLFTGITSVAEWLGLLAGKQTGDSTARTEIRATGAGSGTFDETTDSQEAARDRGDAAWTTATGFSTHSAADVWSVATRSLTTFGTLVSDVATAVWGAVARTLTAATNITSTGGTTVPQTGDSFARLGAPASTVSADIAAVKGDTAAILDDTGTSGVVVAAASKTGYRLSATGVDDVLDEAIGDSTITMRQALKLAVAALGGKLSGAATTTITIRNAADDTDVIVATVDSSGNRSAVTLQL